MKRKFILLIALVLMLVLGLSGCRKGPKALALVVSAQNKVVADGIFDDKEIEVYRIFDNGAVEKLTQSVDYSIRHNLDVSAASRSRAGIQEVTVVDKKYKDPKDKNKFLEAKFYRVNTALAEPDAVVEEEDSFLVFQYHGVKEGKKTNYIFTHNLGHTFKKDEIQEYMTIFKVTSELVEGVPTTVQKDITGEVATAMAAQPKEDYPIQYKAGVFPVTITSGNTEGIVNVVVAGGERPLHKKSANWFDYVLVIPIGWIMQLFSFGGIYGLGIIFATIIIRTIAWPIYAKTNSMSARMNEAQPELQRVQAKYKGRTDKASQQQMQMETMQVYKKHKIGMSSMLLPFVQMPLFIAMYRTVTRILVPGGYWAEKINRVTFLGIDLSIGHHWTSYILAAIVGGTMILLQWLSTRKPKHLKSTTEHKKDDQAAQTARTMKIVSYVMVIMMVIFAIQNNALALYWIIGNAFSIGQTLIHKELARRQYMKKQEETLGGIL